MKYALFILLLFLISCRTIDNNKVITTKDIAEDKNMIIKEVVAEGECTLTEDISAKQAKEVALQNAKNDVIQQVETKVTSFTYSYLSEENEVVNEKFSNLVMLHSQAKILEILNKKISEEKFGKTKVYHAYIKAKVVIPKESATVKTFYIEVKLCDDNGTPRDNFIDGENVFLEIESILDCYIYVFNIYDDGTKFEMIFPYNDQSLSLEKFTKLTLPDKGIYKNKLILKYIGDNKSPTEEEFFILATLDETAIFKLFSGVEYKYDLNHKLYKVNREPMVPGEFYRKVFNLPLDDIAWFVLPYKIYPSK